MEHSEQDLKVVLRTDSPFLIADYYLTSRDHRLELIKKGDVRDALRSSVSELPDAPCYIILSLDVDDRDKWYARLEAGFVVGNILMQGSAMGVGCWFTTGLKDNEQVRIGKAIGLEKADVPIAIVSTGHDK
ncbi:MAG: nitroreductase family protein [Candidatus Methanoperedens sp.]|nr:nitroreductase family protein [Candidatus Methanoperedens sp.]